MCVCGGGGGGVEGVFTFYNSLLCGSVSKLIDVSFEVRAGCTTYGGKSLASSP